MRTIGTFEAKTHFAQLLADVQRTGESVIVQRRGKNVAVLERFETKTDSSLQARRARVLGAFAEIRAPQPVGTRETLEELIEEGRR